MSELNMAYIARAKCNCIKMAIADNPKRLEEIANELADCIKDGLIIERVSMDYVKKNFTLECAECKKNIDKNHKE